MPEFVLSLGSNLGDKVATLTGAIAHLGRADGIVVGRVSRFYRTAPWGFTEQDWYVNACLTGTTERSAVELLDLCAACEQAFARERIVRWGPRTLDVDIVCFGDVHLDGERLTVPHPRWSERAFVMVPLLEIAPEAVIGGRRVADALVALGAGADEVVPLDEAGAPALRRSHAPVE